ncbi:N-acetyltransferase [Sanguibacter sp. HDW7]|uniref:GNAT family N-acetyltransferase n=1 Tax=Sanguibacter sp. HDW7 TaxID=2714931 RepID=UPI00140DD616|nr:GNAT family N-acetyltransferase [Sanguibacter sp. HDW7]QIK83406.1 GNAT family N-acetyltransferase [Sanguibacter sp. HDW7]
MTRHVRVAASDDADALAALAALTFPLACPPGTDPADVAAFVRGNLTAPHLAAHAVDPSCDLLLVADDAAPGAPLAYALVLDDAPPATAVVPAPSRMLSKLYAHPDMHGTPVASQLMAAVLDASRSRGAAAVWLGVNQLNERAQRFYAKHGFEVVGTKHMQVGDRTHDDYVLARAL